MRQILRLAAALVLGALLVGCTSGPAALKGDLTIACGSTEEVCQALAEAFGAQYPGLTVTMTPVTPETVTSVATLGADVWHFAGADQIDAGLKQDLFGTYVPAGAAEVAEEFKQPEGYWTGVAIDPVGFCSNPSVLDQLGVPRPESWDELLDPKLVTQVALGHPALDDGGYAALWSLGVLRGGDAAMTYFKALDHNVIVYPSTSQTLGELIGQGQVATVITTAGECLSQARAGAAVIPSYPSDGTGYVLSAIALLAASPNLPAAQAYVDWSLGAEAQSLAVASGDWRLPLNGDATVDPGTIKAKWIKFIAYDAAAAATARTTLGERFAAEVAPVPA